MELVIRGKLSFEKVFSSSDEAYILICMDNYRERWLEEFAHAAQLERRHGWGQQKKSPDIGVSCFLVTPHIGLKLTHTLTWQQKESIEEGSFADTLPVSDACPQSLKR